jgi:hypothetical protein
MNQSNTHWSTLSPIKIPHLRHHQNVLPLAAFFLAFLLLAVLAPAAYPLQDPPIPTWCADNAEDIDISLTECQALEELYLNTGGANWLDQQGWLNDTAVCSWDRITCDAGHVSILTLSTNNLVGVIPDSISGLSFLTSLDLTGNQLSGPIPSSLGSMIYLTSLSLGGNQLGGSIPIELGQLSFLEQLDLGDNKLSGSIPSQLGNLSSLTIWLFLGGNQLEGPIPEPVCNLSPTLTNIDYNKLDVSDLSPEACDALFFNWRETQTVPPTNLAANPITVNTVQGSTAVTADVMVSWLPIAYTGDGGNYEVFTKQISSDTIESRGTTADKEADSLQITIDGDPANFIYFVRTNTPAHPTNQNALTSVESEEVELGPVAIRMLDIRANTPLLYLPALAPLALLFLTGIAVAVISSRERVLKSNQEPVNSD